VKVSRNKVVFYFIYLERKNYQLHDYNDRMYASMRCFIKTVAVKVKMGMDIINGNG